MGLNERTKDMNPLTEKLRPYVNKLKADAEAGCAKAAQVISLYQMHVASPADPGAPALCEAALEDWKAAAPHIA
jgi:hypothetical protein